jgi:hypothetical protein
MSFEFKETVTLYMPTIEKDIQSLKEAATTGDKKLLAELAAIHEGLTANYNNYSAPELEASLATWVQPYPKPIITNHDQMSESLGRVMAARMDKEADGTPYIRLQVAINGTDNVEKCLDERFLTGSVGGKAESAKCSICNVDWAQAEGYKRPCKHERGKVYNGKLAYMELSGISWKEYSFVNIPADAKSGFRKVMADVKAGETDTEDLWVRPVSFYSLDMNKESIMEFSESEKPHDVLTEMKKKDAHVTYLNVKGTFLSVSAYDYEEKDNTNNDEKSTFNKTYTTIDDKLLKEAQAQKTAEENDDMSQKSQKETEDILDITEQLSADLASKSNEETAADESVEESTEEVEEAKSEESEAAADESAEETTSEDEVVEEKKDEAEEASSESTEQLESKEDIESADELVVEDKEEEKEGAETEESKEDETSEDFKAQLEALQVENAKLKKSLHFMLAERVVDAKIALGLVEMASRATELTEHSTRTASSLADALRDLEKMPAQVSRQVAPVIEQRSLASDKDSDSTVTHGDVAESKERQAPLPQQFEDMMVDVMMNRKKL